MIGVRVDVDNGLVVGVNFGFKIGLTVRLTVGVDVGVTIGFKVVGGDDGARVDSVICSSSVEYWRIC